MEGMIAFAMQNILPNIFSQQCHFVGLDIVPLQPDLKRVGSSNMASRITWVQSNFLEALPFPDEEFDFV